MPLHQGGQQNPPYAAGYQDVNGCENLTGESTLGDLIADSQLEATHAEDFGDDIANHSPVDPAPLDRITRVG